MPQVTPEVRTELVTALDLLAEDAEDTNAPMGYRSNGHDDSDSDDYVWRRIRRVWWLFRHSYSLRRCKNRRAPGAST